GIVGRVSAYLSRQLGVLTLAPHRGELTRGLSRDNRCEDFQVVIGRVKTLVSRFQNLPVPELTFNFIAAEKIVVPCVEHV
ncbi:MAG TPA: hypothetical protein PLK42_10605, partial [Casimicrobium sp.]|nr:hypothetical protein [Casimicrobium sp.]